MSGLVSLCAIFGDLATSVVKRDLGIKDWSAALPGHGGFLDRANSLVFAAPVFFHYYRFFFLEPVFFT
jgi:phosphatidate cytidylyltransferase